MDTARRAVAELAASQHRAFTRRQAAAIDFSAKRIATGIRDGWISEPMPGVLLLVDGPPTWEQKLHALILATNGRGIVSHRAAARLHDFDGFGGAGNATLELSVPRAMRYRPPTPAVIHHV